MPVKIRQLISRSPTRWVRAWLKVLGPPFIALTAVVCVLAAAMVFHKTGKLDLGLWVLCTISLICIHFGTSSLNDYFDYRSGTDNINLTPTSLSGGSRVIQQGALSPGELLAGGSIFVGLGSIIGTYLAYLKGWLILALGIIGVFFAVGYVHPKINLSKRGLGELAVALAFGPLMLCGAYYVQMQEIDLNVIIIGSLMGALAGCVLWINEIPDYDADKTTGKTNWVVRLGKKKAAYAYIVLLNLIYLSILLLIFKNILPKSSWIVFLTYIMAIRAQSVALKNYNAVEKLLPANALTIAITITGGLLLSLAFLIA